MRKAVWKATALANQSGQAQRQGRYAEALSLVRQAAALQRRLLGEDHTDYTHTLGALVVVYKGLSDYEKALALAEKVYQLDKQLLTVEHPKFAAALNNLASLCQATGDSVKALQLYQQARELVEKQCPESDPKYTAVLGNLGEFYMSSGDYANAVNCLEKALDLKRKYLPESDPAYTIGLHNLAAAYRYLGDYNRALSLAKQARELTKLHLGEKHPLYPSRLNNLALVYEAKGDYSEALALAEEYHKLVKESVPEGHVRFIISLGELGLKYKNKGDYGQALPLLERALALAQKHFPKTRMHAASLHNLAALYRDAGRAPEALPLFSQSSELVKQLSIQSHPDYAAVLGHIGMTYQAMGKSREAAQNYEMALTIRHEHLDRTFTAQSARQRLEFLSQQQSSLSYYLSTVPESTPAAEIYRQVLAWKAAASARQSEEHPALHAAHHLPLLQQLRSVRAGLAQLARVTPSVPKQQAEWLKRIDELETQKEEIETRLAQASAAFRQFRELRRAGAEEVARALPPQTALVDFLTYTHLTVPPGGKGPFISEYRLLAFLLTRDRPPICVRLGPAEPLRRAANSWRRAVSNHESPDLAGAELGRPIWHPLRQHLAGINTVLIVTDAALDGLPFAALPGQRPGSYLIEDLAIGYVTSGRHILELAADVGDPAASGLLAVGDVTYTAATGAQTGAGKAGWLPLPGTRFELEHIAQVFRKVFPKEREPLLLAGGSADVSRVKRELAPDSDKLRWRYLHLATHGYFEQPLAQVPPSRPANESLSYEAERQRRVYGRNPMLMTGLVLAGANQQDGRGILTAEEVLSLDLRGTELVVLSACSTGLGKLTSGEAVQGLQQAFQAAKARSLVASLWRIDDAATALLMEEFYTNLWQKKLPKLEALRQAQLFVLKNPDRVTQRRKVLGAELAKRDLELGKPAALPNDGKLGDRSHPALWAAFVLSGDIR